MTLRAETQPQWAVPESSESPWMRATRAILRKKIAVVCIAVIIVL